MLTILYGFANGMAIDTQALLLFKKCNLHVNLKIQDASNVKFSFVFKISIN